ncbi:hypothetical protein CON65_22810 [Bacillus pseudomycoides]|uniref:Uncharacterized protein n=1 Tax=Bacillus pseudomycoides TaxID=64104 RepID=A0AA91ZRH2_9BACI|nr:MULTISPECIES: hypothetical protein [Bacillus]PEB50314.1 hypothetical protein COO03_23040 [Bacillus sp. AFS098217]PED80424.1 hypothetical protein CON65_22810 [Bacillus pseudomycoides]PEU12047.1 hypothetical protein CN525_21140 [Bacillus sp. AFS014408]PEU17768.1 hypothetical protein CN524_01775 [Bacillus sp. AFS019443]PFW60855.1 hypothetical protein COL20_19720 [Bacillus sp. AFS075034]
MGESKAFTAEDKEVIFNNNFEGAISKLETLREIAVENVKYQESAEELYKEIHRHLRSLKMYK